MIPLNLTLLLFLSWGPRPHYAGVYSGLGPKFQSTQPHPKMSSIHPPTGLVSTTLREGISGYIDRSKLEGRLYDLFGYNVEVIVSKYYSL